MRLGDHRPARDRYADLAERHRALSEAVSGNYQPHRPRGLLGNRCSALWDHLSLPERATISSHEASVYGVPSIANSMRDFNSSSALVRCSSEAARDASVTAARSIQTSASIGCSNAYAGRSAISRSISVGTTGPVMRHRYRSILAERRLDAGTDRTIGSQIDSGPPAMLPCVFVHALRRDVREWRRGIGAVRQRARSSFRR